MRVFSVLLVLLISGCATNMAGSFRGEHARNPGPDRYARLGAITNEDVPDLDTCRRNPLAWCSGEAAGENCRCLLIHEAQEKVRQIARRRDGRGH